MGQPESKGPYRFGRFELNSATRQLLAEGQPVSLGARAFDVLLALIERRERLVTKDELLELAWPGLVVEENNLQVQISALRKLLGQQSISTIPGRGYRFTCELVEEPAVPAPLQAAASSPYPSTSARPRYFLVAVLALAFAVAIAAAAVLWPPRPTLIADSKSVAVLPFTSMSDDKANAFFADGVHEDVLTQLALLGELKVISRTSVAEYRDTKKNMRQIGAELGVASLVEGSVRRAGNRVRVTVQLIDAGSDEHLWGNTYDREMKDIFAIQSDIAAQIARALKVKLTPLDENRLARAPTDNPLAYELVLRQQQIRSQGLPADFKLDEGIKLLEQAVELDPNFASAWAKLGRELAFKEFGAGGDPKRLQRAREAIDRALALAPQDLFVQRQVGLYYYYGERDFERAAQYFETLLQTAPNDAATLYLLSWIRRRQGRWLDVNTLLERLLAIDPRHIGALGERRNVFVYFRQFDAAWAAQKRITELRPDDIGARCILHEVEYLKTGSWAAYDAWRAAQAAEITSPVVWQRDIRRALARRDWDGLLRLIDAAPAGFPVDDGFRAQILLVKGEHERALKLLHVALARAQADWKREPANLDHAARVVMIQAQLGERGRAFSDFQRYRDLALARRDLIVSEEVMRLEIFIHALLGDREQALAALGRQLRGGGRVSANFWRHELPLVSLWDDPAFQALLDANNSPLPIANRNPVAGV